MKWKKLLIITLLMLCFLATTVSARYQIFGYFPFPSNSNINMSVNLSNYVPYTGADKDLNLGSNKVIASNLCYSNGTNCNITLPSFGSYTIYGADFTGSDGTSGRTYAYSNPARIDVDGINWVKDIDYVYILGNIIFNNRLWDDQLVTIWT